MKRKLCRALSALLIACLCLGLLPPALADGKPLPVDTSSYPTTIDVRITGTTAFERANECYLAGDYLNAESYYMFALKRISSSKRYTKGDVCNNLVLTYLQLGQNDEAYALCRYMLEEGLAKTDRDAYGYMLNMLVCAHAKGITAAEELKYAVENDLFSFSKLNSLSEEKPGMYRKLLVAMIYNAVYIDMEGGAADGAASYAFYPIELVDGLVNADIMEDIGAILDEDGGEISDAERNMADEMMSRRDYLEFLYDLLNTIDEANSEIYDTYDPDISALKKYLSALMEKN
ncbi:MAG: hypothetical protein IKQ41_06360 [Clostridia bacterium]|nr:hypothetical protein [Clostridia bacterium]